MSKYLSVEVNGEDVDVHLPITPTDVYGFDKPLVKVLENGVIIVGYLAHDDSCSNPLTDCDGMGHIFSFNRRHVNSMDESPESFKENHKKIMHMVVELSYFEHGNCLWGVRGTMGSMPDFQWDGTSMAGIWVPDSSCIDHIRSKAIGHAAPGADVAWKSKLNPDGTVDDKNLNVITLTMPDGSEHTGFKSFAGAYRSAARRLGVKLTVEETRQAEAKVAAECAEQACDVYTRWCNGECYGYVVAWFDKTGNEVDHESCWGYVGDEKYVIEEVTGVFENVRTRMQKEYEETLVAEAMP